MTKMLVRRVHAVARGQKGLDEETYQLRLQAVGVASSKDFTKAQYVEFMKGLARLPDVLRRRVGAAIMARGKAA